MASEAQIAANRRNARASTGPKTDEGRARAALNGLKHGLYAADPVLPWEDREAFEALVADLVAKLQPANGVELALLRQYADASWRRERCPTLETGMLAGAVPESDEDCPEGVHPTAWALGQAWLARGKEINRLSLHESRLARLADRALDRLLALQAERRKAEAELASNSQSPLPPLREREGEGQRQRPVRSFAPGAALPPDPRPAPLVQGREREQDQALAPELASLRRKAA